MLNVIQIKIINVFILSIYMIPNLINITLPFIVIFGLVLCFYKLDKDKEIANKPALSNSLLTFGPTFSTRLKFITDPKSEDKLSLIDYL